MTTINYFKNGSVDFANTAGEAVKPIALLISGVAFIAAWCSISWGMNGQWGTLKALAWLTASCAIIVVCAMMVWWSENRQGLSSWSDGTTKFVRRGFEVITGKKKK